MVIKSIIQKDQRKINYLRLSVTDRCNLRCKYCMPEDGVVFQSHNEILSYEEILHLVKVATDVGIRKVRLTGGEPLVRKGFIDFLEKMKSIKALDEISLTTNGVLLKKYAANLRDCGICRINISLDTLKPDRFLYITGQDYFHLVWEGIQEAEKIGFNPIKINVVAINGFNDDEILDFARLAIESPLNIRFIEFMPMGEKNNWSSEKFISTEEIQNKIRILGKLHPIANGPLDGPAERYRIDGGKGELGFIGALSNHFCNSCNRLRLTAEGHLRSCLFSDKEIDVKAPLRNGESDEYLVRLLMRAIEEKPKDHGPIKPERRKCVRQMSSIGG